MLRFILRRFLWMIPTLIAISIIPFVIIQAPPGDFLATYVSRLTARGEQIDQATVVALRVRYGLDRPIYIQYFKWMWNILQGDLGRSLEWNRPVSELIAERLPWSLTISFSAFIFVYLVGIPIGTFSATHQYSIRNYLSTLIGFMDARHCCGHCWNCRLNQGNES